jgi:type IV pilus assembly protein PilC
MCFVVVASLMTFVVPVFSKLYKQLRVPLPLLTQILVDTSATVRQYWWVILIVVACAAFLFKRYSKSAYLRTVWDNFKFKVPVFAKVNRAVVVSHFIRTFAMLAGAGIPLARALEVASIVTHNSKIYGIAKNLQQSIEAGNPVASSLKKHRIFPPMIIQLAASGEEAGMLSEMLNKGVDFLDKDIEMMVNNLIVKLEPALTVIMGAIVGVVLIGVYLPMFDYMRHLK